MKAAIQRKEAARLQLLRTIYNATDGRTGIPVPIKDALRDDDDDDAQELTAAAQYLVGECLLKSHGLGHTYAITHQGVVEVEASIKYPSKGTTHFAPTVINYVNGNNNVIGSQQVGGSGNTATVNQTVTNSVHSVVQSLKEKAAELPPEKKAEAESVIDQIASLIEKGPQMLKAITILVKGLSEYSAYTVPFLTSQIEQITHFLGGTP
ncbi:MAG: hypothetical protein QM784_09670 [Polyangiaceae bacterium]